MSGTSPKAGETGGSPASSSPAVPGNNVPQQQPLQPQIPQQLSAVTNSGPSTAIHNGAPQQPLFLKPHPTILPTYSSNTPAISSSAITSTTAISTDKSPLATTKPVVGALPTPPSGTVAAPAISAPFNPHVARGQGVKEPLPTDVICGRGKMTASHPANRRFRELVDSHKASYQNSKRRDEKTRITCELVDKLRAEGRFVLFDPVTKLWHEVSEEYAREKVSHSLRSRSSTEQRIANASNSIKMLNNAVNPDANDSMVSIAPRGVQPLLTPLAVPKTTKPTAIADIISSVSPSKVAVKPKPQQHISNNKKSPTIANKKKTKGTTIHKGSSSSGRSKHSTLKPGLDEIVKRLIKDQQKLLRMMIQKETDRFTSAAAMGGSHPPRPPMPLSYKAEASAVSKLTTSLPKLGMGDLEETGNTVAAIAPAVSNPKNVVATGASNSDGAAPTDETHSSNMSTTVTA